MKTVNIAPGVTLPAEDFIESATGMLAKRGKGKSGGVKVIEEELLKVQLPFTVFDPVGIHWGLKSSFRGDKPSGHEILVVGGRHGDLPLVRKAGREVARSIADSDANLVIDLKGSPHAAYREFVTDFCDELLDINQRPRLNIFEEAHRLLPQKVRPDQTACLDAVQRTITEGRNSALGALIVSQRPATVNKDTLTQVDNLILMGMTSPQDRKAVKEWVEQNAEAADLDKFLAGLAGLQTREGWLWIPDKDILQKFRFKDFQTFHPDRTHLRKLGLLTVKPAQTDVKGLAERLGEKMKAVVEDAKANDPAVLKAKIREMQRTIDSKVRVVADEQVRIVEKVVEVVQEYLPASMLDLPEKLRFMAADIDRSFEKVREANEARLAGQTPTLNGKAMKRISTGRYEGIVPAHAKSTSVVMVKHADSGLERVQQKILNEMASLVALGFPEPDRVQLALFAGYTNARSGGFSEPLGALIAQGYLHQPNVGHIAFTPKGEQAAQPADSVSTSEQLQQKILSRLDSAHAKILGKLISTYPNALSRAELAAETGYSNPRSGGFSEPLGKLVALRLVETPGTGMARASQKLFLEA